MEFQPLDGNPSSGWKSHQGLVGFPSICPKMAGWKSNHPSVKGRQGFMISFQIFYFSFLEFSKLWKWKWITIHLNLEIFFSWDGELSWAVSCVDRIVPFWSWCWAKENWTWCLLGSSKGPSIDDSSSAMPYVWILWNAASTSSPARLWIGRGGELCLLSFGDEGGYQIPLHLSFCAWMGEI